MTEHELELRLLAVARALDKQAPAFDPAILHAPPPRRIRARTIALAAVVAFAGLTVAPGALSGLRDLFGIDHVQELGPVPPDVAPPYVGRRVAADGAQGAVPFRIRTIPSRGAPEALYVRDDIAGGMVTVAYEGRRILLTEWPATRVEARIAVVPVSGAAEDTTIGDLPALWIEGAARGTFTLVGADRAIHRERFDVAEGVLLWEDDGIAFLLQGAGPKTKAIELAAGVSP